jgi:hypothetical protein
MMKSTFLLIAVAAGFVSARTQAGAGAPVTAATTRADMLEVRATVTQVEGLVSVRESEDAPFRPVTVGMALAMGAEFRTGPRSRVTVSLPAGQTLTIDRLGLVKLLEAYKGDARFHTDVGMRYGRVRYEVEAGGLQHESIIRAPSSALAVRGTVVEMSDDAFGSRVRLIKGSAQAKTAQGVVALHRAEDGSGEGVEISDRDASLAGSLLNGAATPMFETAALAGGEGEAFAFATSTSGTTAGTPGELVNVAGRTGGFDFLTPAGGGGSNGTGPGGGNGVLPDPPLTGPGKLAFQLLWTSENGASRGVPNLNLVVESPTGKTFFPSSGRAEVVGNVKVGRDDLGGRKSGREKIQWLADCPPGVYSYSVHYRGGSEPATFTVRVSLNGARIGRPFRDTLDPKDREADFTIAVPPGFEAPAKGKGTGTGIVPTPKRPTSTNRPPAKPPRR